MNTVYKDSVFLGNSLVVQWLGPCDFTSESLIPGQGTSYVAQPKKKKKKRLSHPKE